MIIDKNIDEKLNNGKLVIGLELNDGFSQLSYCYLNSDNPETLTTVAGKDKYDIPTVLCKRPGVNQWFFGKEALRVSKEEDGYLIRNLISMTRYGKNIEIEGETFYAVDLLSLFIRRFFSLFSMIIVPDKIERIMITTESVDDGMLDKLKKAVAMLQFDEEKILIQPYADSIYSYILHQSKELWQYQVAVLDFSGDYLKSYLLDMNKKTTPIVALIKQEAYEEIRKINSSLDDEEKKVLMESLDIKVSDMIAGFGTEKIISAVYLIGDGFEGEWMDCSLRLICRNRRVFRGNNLYSKGAAYAAKDRIVPFEEDVRHLFLGKEKLKCNIGMKAVEHGVEVYVPLLDAGVNWFEVKKKIEVILESGKFFTILVTPLDGSNKKEIEILLSGLKDRPYRATRLQLHFSFRLENICVVMVKDLGFGEIYPASDMEWVQEIVL